MFSKKGVLKNFVKITGRKHLCQSLFFSSVSNFIEKETLKQVFPVDFAKFLKVH